MLKNARTKANMFHWPLRVDGKPVFKKWMAPVVFAGLLLFVAFPLQAQQPQYQQDAIDHGAALYASNCTVCHGDGAGVPGIDLKAGVFRHSKTDEDLLTVIKNGEPGTAMPPHPNFTSYDVLSVVAYIRTMRDFGSEQVKLGDPVKGRLLFDGEGGCLNCHRVNGKGSYAALDLSDVGALHPPAYLERVLLDPNAAAAETPGGHLVRAVTKAGTVVVGRRLNEDTFTIQLTDEDGNLISLQRANLRSLTVMPGSTMPSLKGRLSPEQINDLVAYLVSLNPNSAPLNTGEGQQAPNAANQPTRGSRP